MYGTVDKRVDIYMVRVESNVLDRFGMKPYLKAFPVFNVLETCREYLLTIDLQIVEFIKKFMERFFEKCEICRHGPNYVQKL